MKYFTNVNLFIPYFKIFIVKLILNLKENDIIHDLKYIYDFKIAFNLFFQDLFFLNIVYTYICIHMHVYPYFIMPFIGNYYCFYV